MSSQKLVRLGLCAACLSLAGCATTAYTRSGVATLPPGARGKAGSNAKLEIQGLEVRIETLDYAKKQAEIPPLGLRLVFDPRELGYSFDPSQVTLRGADSVTWKPRVHGPGWFATASWTCNVGAQDEELQSYHVLAPGACFELTFDMPLTQDARLELELGGLARGRARIEPVRLALVRRDGRSIDRVYWLEAIGYLLAPIGY
jgi:hypothetical protein